MPHSEHTNLGTVSAVLNYSDPTAFPNGKETISLGAASAKLRKQDSHTTTITDVRSCTDDFRLDKNGFEYLSKPTSLKPEDFTNTEYVKEHYYPEAVEIIKSVTGASEVLCESHLVRLSTWEEAQEEAERVRREKGEEGMCQLMNPVRTTHVDQSDLGAEQTLRKRFGDEEAERLMKKRWAIMNLWRPIRPINRDPLAVCDYRTLSVPNDLTAIDLVIPNFGEQKGFGRPWMDGKNTIERWDVKYNPKQRWYYRSNMQPEECILIKIFDSRRDGTARCCPHSSFQTEADEGPARESIEVRTLVFWDE